MKKKHKYEDGLFQREIKMNEKLKLICKEVHRFHNFRFHGFCVQCDENKDFTRRVEIRSAGNIFGFGMHNFAGAICPML